MNTSIDLSPKAIADWIGDRTEEYDYFDNKNCALAQYVKSEGFEDVSVAGDYFVYEGGTFPIPDNLLLSLQADNFADLKTELLRA